MTGPSKPPIGLPASLEGATREQRRVAELIASGPRGSVPSPFLAMLDAPPLAEAIQAVGAVLRFSSILPDAEREIAILATAGAVRCGYEWNYHAPIARAAGVAEAVVAATLPDAFGMEDEPAATLIRLCRRVASEGESDPDLLTAAVERFGRAGATEIVAIAGYYRLLAGFIKAGGFDQPFSPFP
ncbi:carboxymuconolactone decarboxylase family protein [Rhizorhabdus histidinilytica]|jgi:4-carboxymuconolactone decarboxylase|uniref:4-carboxymuconolactone decarboxylase n=1 Tax=Rhizorhabdus histidinilytica TaxID=439228 RepID=A0A1T5AQQ8_9SPHN|nr:carboxymuconolactone decarboxylase family protein [Rhizorhabdus histidinilytica]SKB37209.1 4-carboxymuconolactone decarboxylase [Rhizorhabdus histidinilytica]